jgi:GNAT superfamily N-acetyltransferase
MTDFIRFQARHPRPSGRYPGVFALANDLAHRGTLSADERAWWRANNDWFEATAADPWKVAPSLFDRTKYPHTFCWFKAGATNLMARVEGYLRLLDAHGVEWVRLHSTDPGTVVFEDDVQVVVALVVKDEMTGEARLTCGLDAVALRRAAPDDRGFAYNVTEQAMRTYVEALMGSWDEEAQRRQSDACCHDPACRVVMVRSVAAGLLFVTEGPSELFLRRIFLLPDYQRSGIGTHLLRQLRDRADREQKPLRLRVLVNNPARRLYERVGFRLTRSTDHHHHLEYLRGEASTPRE